MCGCGAAFLSDYFNHLFYFVTSLRFRLFMLALCNRADHYIFILFLSFFLLSFFFLSSFFLA